MMLDPQPCLSRQYAEIVKRKLTGVESGHNSNASSIVRASKRAQLQETNKEAGGKGKDLRLITFAKSSPNPKYSQLSQCNHTTFANRCHKKEPYSFISEPCLAEMVYFWLMVNWFAQSFTVKQSLRVEQLLEGES
jgi:hypothetical protein